MMMLKLLSIKSLFYLLNFPSNDTLSSTDVLLTLKMYRKMRAKTNCDSHGKMFSTFIVKNL